MTVLQDETPVGLLQPVRSEAPAGQLRTAFGTESVGEAGCPYSRAPVLQIHNN